MTLSTPPSWTQIESLLGLLPRRVVVAFAVRAARRIAPAVAQTRDHYGPEVFEWMNAADSAMHIIERYCLGLPVSRFTLDLASDISRCAANSMANASQILGPAPHREIAELSFASAAFAADTARSKNPTRAATVAVQAIRTAANGSEITPEQLTDFRTLQAQTVGDPNVSMDPTEHGQFGSLWPHGEPDWFTQGLIQFQRAGVRVAILRPIS